MDFLNEIKGKFIAFAAKELLSLTIDEAQILDVSVAHLIEAFKSGSSAEEAFTSTLNKFYHAELSEGQKISTAFLSFVSRVVHKLV